MASSSRDGADPQDRDVWEESSVEAGQEPEPLAGSGDEDEAGDTGDAAEDDGDLDGFDEDEEPIVFQGFEEDGDDGPEEYGEEEEDEEGETGQSALSQLGKRATGALPKGLAVKAGGALAVAAGVLVFMTFSQRQAQVDDAAQQAAIEQQQQTIETASVPDPSTIEDVEGDMRRRMQEAEQARRDREQAARKAELDARRAELDRLQRQAEETQQTFAGTPQPGSAGGGLIVPPAQAGQAAMAVETESIQALREQLRMEELQREARANWAPMILSDMREEREAEKAEEAEEAPPQPTGSAGQILAAAEDARTSLQQMRAQLLAQEFGGQPAPAPSDPPDVLEEAEEPAFPIIGEGVDNRTVRKGTRLHARLMMTLDSRTPGPVSAMVTRDVYTRDRLDVLIPSGTKVLGNFTQQGKRLAVDFHEIQFGDGRSVSLSMKAMDRAGRSGLADSVNMHYAQRIGAVGLIGAITALPQALVARQGRGGVGAQQGVAVVGQSTMQVGAQAVQPMMARPPTIKVRSGKTIRIWLQSDLRIPE